MTIRQYRNRMPTMESNGGEHDSGSAAEFDLFDLFVDRIDRELVTLRIENETMAGGEGEGTTDAYTYRPSRVVKNMHHAPRGIGNTNRLASLLVKSSTGNNDYADGLKLFVGFFIITPFVIWFVLLFGLKLKHEYCKRTRGKSEGKESKTKTIAQIPTPKTLISDDPNAKTPTPITPKDQTTKAIIPTTSWIAGGDLIDMVELSRAGVSRKERKKLVVRSWRIQSTFLSVSILIPVLSVVLLECGWKPLETAMQEMQELNNDIEILAYRGRDAVGRLETSKQELFDDNELIRSILEYSYANSNEPDRKSLKDGKSNRSHNNYGGNVNRNDPPRRAQFFQPEQQATSFPTLPMTSDFGSPFFMPLTEQATSSPFEQQVDIGNTDPWKPKRKPSPKVPQQQDDSLEKINNSNKSSSSSIFFKNNQTPTLTPTLSIPTSGIFIEEWCPDAFRFIGIEELNYWTDAVDNLTEKTQVIHQIFNSLEGSFPSMESPLYSHEEEELWNDALPTSSASSAFQFVTDTTSYIDDEIEWFLANDWLIKLLVLVLNVVNGLLLVNVYFFSKNDVIHQPTRFYVAYVLIPLFVVAAVSIVVLTVAAGVAVLINSDFCAGGSGVEGPQGTIEEVILTLQKQEQSDGVVPNEALNLVYDAVDYYWTGCLTDNPLEFLEEFSDEIDDAAARVNEFTLLLPIDDANLVNTNGMVSQLEQIGSTFTDTSTASPPRTTLSVLNKACQRDMSFLTPAVHDLKSQVDKIRTNINKLSDTISCGQVSPLLRRVSHGVVCVESPQGLSVLWGTSFGISLLCFVLLTIRAALYNSVKYKKRRPTKPRRIVEKEFDEYKEFMSKYYGEEAMQQWHIDGFPLPTTKLELQFDLDIDLKETFDTAKSSKESDGDSLEDDGSENAGIFIRKKEDGDSSYGSSYDSECSDDDNSSDSDSENGDDISSAIGSFLSETKSIAMQTIHSLRNVKSLLAGSRTRNNDFPSHIGNSDLRLGDQNVNESDEEEIMDYTNEVFFSRKLDTVSDIGADDDDGKSVTNSISDNSLYLPTPTSRSDSTPASMFDKNNILQLSKDNDFCDEDGVGDEEDEILASHSMAMAKYSWTPTNEISALSPAAPRKPLSFLARTLYTRQENDRDYTNEELNSLVRPTQLTNLNSFRSKKARNTKVHDF